MRVTDDAVLDFIKSYHGRKGFAPSIREIADGVGLASASPVHAHLRSLEKVGRIRREPRSSRAIVVVAA